MYRQHHGKYCVLVSECDYDYGDGDGDGDGDCDGDGDGDGDCDGDGDGDGDGMFLRYGHCGKLPLPEPISAERRYFR